MKVIRVHNPSGLRATKQRSNGMATKRRKRNKRRANRVLHTSAPNPRRRRRRRNPATRALAMRTRNPATRATRAVNPRRRRRNTRRAARRFNPTAMRIGELVKKAIYGAGGAISTRAVAAVAQGLVPAQFASNPLAGPIIQAAAAATLVRWGVKKFMGDAAADLAMLGGLISAGLAAADIYFPNVQGSLVGILRAPISAAPQAVISPAQQAALAGYGDVYDVPNSQFAGFGDVYDVPDSIFA